MGKIKTLGIVFEDIYGDLYVQPNDLDECYLVPKSFSEGAFVGDNVLFHVKNVTKKSEVKPTKYDGTPVSRYAVVDSIQEYSNFYYSGMCEEREDSLVFIPDDKRMQEYNVFKTKRGGAQDFERVVAQISRKKFSQEFKAGVEKIYGSSEEILPYIKAASDSIYFNLGWGSDEGVSESDLSAPSTKRRKDLRTKTVVALSDGKSPCDRAFSMETDGGDYIVYLHLVDVCDEIPLGSKLDLHAKQRLKLPDGFDGTRSLFPERILDHLEFKEGVDRNAITITARYGADLELKSLYIDETIVNLTIKATYEQIDLALKIGDSSRMQSFLERMMVVRDLSSVMFSFAGEVIAKMNTRGAFVGTCLAPSFLFETRGVSELVEKKLYDGELLEKCLLSAISCALGETAQKEGIPVLYEAEWALDENDWAHLSSYCRGPLTKENVCYALSSLYNCCERGVYERSAYNEIFSRFSETYIYEKPTWNTLKGSGAAVALDGPLTNYVGLAVLRLLKSAANKTTVGCDELVKSTVMDFKTIMPLVYKTSRAIYNKAMFAHAAALPIPAETIVTAFDSEKVTVSLADGSVGYIYSDAKNVVSLDSDAKTLTVGARTYSYGDYITVVMSDADDKLEVVKYTPIG